MYQLRKNYEKRCIVLMIACSFGRESKTVRMRFYSARDIIKRLLNDSIEYANVLRDQ